MPKDVNSTVILEAVKHPANFKAIIFCSVSLISVGMLMIVLGLVIILLDYVDMGPPHFDLQYSRYVGTSLAPIVGPMFIGFGSLIIVGNILLVGYATRSHYLRSNNPTRGGWANDTGSSRVTRRGDSYGLV